MGEHTLSSIYELLETVADGQRQIRAQLDRIKREMSDLKLRVGGVETTMKRIELRLELIGTGGVP